MDRRMVLVVAAFLVAMTTGCMEVRQELTVERDGSGSLSGHYVFGEQMTAMFGAAEGMAGGDVKTEGNVPMSKEDVARMYDGEGIKIKESSFEKKEERIEGSFFLTFEDISSLIATEGFKVKVSFSKDGNGNLVFTVASGMEGPGLATKGETPPGMEAMGEEMMKATIEPMLQGLKAEFSITMPSEIIRTNADRKEGRKAIWIFDKEKIKKLMVAKAEAEPLTAVCSGKGVAFAKFETLQVEKELDWEEPFMAEPTVPAEAGKEVKATPRPATNLGGLMEAEESIGEMDDVSEALEKLKSPDVRIQKEAIQGLVRMGKGAVPSLIRALKDKDGRLRRLAASALGEISDRQAIDPLIDLLKDSNFLVRAAAAEALGKIGDHSALHSLASLLGDEEILVRRRGAWAAERIRR